MSPDQPSPIVSKGYAEIIERLERASGPDRELDVLIGCCFDLTVDGDTSLRYSVKVGSVAATAKKAESYQNIWSTALPRYTASLDASLALVGESLPIEDWWWVLATTDIGGRPGFVVETGNRNTPLLDNLLVEAPTAPLAVLLAMFHALEEMK